MSDLLEQVRALASGLFAEAHGWRGGEDRSLKLGDRSGGDDWDPSAKIIAFPSRRKARGGFRQSKWWQRAERKAAPVARAGEVRLVEFIRSEIARCGVSKQVVYERLMAGKYLGVQIRRPSARVTFVRVPRSEDGSWVPDFKLVNKASPGEVLMKEFVESESVRLGICSHSVYRRIERGHYAHMEFRRVNRRVVFVKAKEMEVGSSELGNLTTDTDSPQRRGGAELTTDTHGY